MNVLGYAVNRDGQLIGAPCACYSECLPGQRGELGGRKFGEGHSMCSPVPDNLLAAEKAGEIYARHIRNGQWKFYIASSV